MAILQRLTIRKLKVLQVFKIHPDNPQKRLLSQVAAGLQKDAVILYPTDSAYALGCRIGCKEAMERIRRIRQLDESHDFTLVCRDLSELSSYAQVNNSIFRFLKAHTPGSYTFILEASKEVPRRLQHPKRKTIGLRIPENAIALGLLEELGEPLMSVTLILPGSDYPLADPEEMVEQLEKHVDFLIDGGSCGIEPTTVVDLTSGTPKLLRQGRGEVDWV